MANPLDSSADNSSAFHTLIRNFTRLPTTLKTFSLSDTHHHPIKSNRSANDDSYNLLSKNNPVRKLFACLFLANPPIDPHPQPSQLDDRTKDNLILDGFLKNNGGYLDDSGSSSACSELGDEGDEEDHPNAHIHPGNNLSIFAKKHQPETTDQAAPVTSKRSLHYPHPLNPNNLSKKLLHFHLNNKSDHRRKPATVVFNKPERFDSGHDRHSVHSVKPYVEHLETCQAPKAEQARFKNAYLECPDGVEQNQALGKSHLAGRKCQSTQHWYGPENDTGGREDEAALSLNLKYLRSSTFPTKNSILDSPYDLRSGRTQPLAASSDRSPLNLHAHSPQPGSLDDHHSDFDEFKSPFRNLVLGQDDLLRSN